jgi:serine protease Do
MDQPPPTFDLQALNPDPAASPVASHSPAEPEPVAVDATATPPGSSNDPPRQRRGTRFGAILGASLLSATLASAATVVLVRQTTPGVTVTPATATTTSTTVSRAVKVVDLTDVVATAKASVVTITANGITAQGFSPFGQVTEGIGSGVILTSSGYILTNRHVVDNSTSLTVELADGRTFPATIVREASDTDLALVKIDATGLAAASIGSSAALEVGQTALAIGSPLGTYTETVTQGIISGLGREVTVTNELTRRQTTLTNLIQTDAAINAGNSGGPLLDAAGNVIGLNTATSTSAEGIGFAIPIDAAAELISVADAGQVS